MTLPATASFRSLCRSFPVPHELEVEDWACWAEPDANHPDVAFIHLGVDQTSDDPARVWLPRFDQTIELLVKAGIGWFLLEPFPGGAWLCGELKIGAGLRLDKGRYGIASSKEEAAYRLLLDLVAQP